MSSQFRDIETTPNPTEIVFRQALKQLLKDTSGADKAPNAGGNRLYLYFAGHGMTRERLAEAALYTAELEDEQLGPHPRFALRRRSREISHLFRSRARHGLLPDGSAIRLHRRPKL
jgi:hypothetical protein